jgi:hypothetical protein
MTWIKVLATKIGFLLGKLINLELREHSEIGN